MKQQIIRMSFILLLVVTMAAPSVMAASFDLLLKGHWAYTDLALLADAGLLEGYSRAEELMTIFPLTRYEVALMVGDVFELKTQSPQQPYISADTLMWEILGNTAKNMDTASSSEVVAQARRDSERVYGALTRLIQEFSKELGVLGLIGNDSIVRPFSLVVKSGMASKKVLGYLGVTQVLGNIPATSAGVNGFTLSKGLRIEVVAPTYSRWDYDLNEAQNEMKKTELAKTAAPVRFDKGNEKVKDKYAPVEITALHDQSIQTQELMVETAADPAEEGSLKLQPHMMGGRPIGLLTSYFLDRTHN